MKHLFDNVSAMCSKLTTKEYSTSFSLGIHFLNKKLHDPIYAIYGFVRFADEIVDSFHDYDKKRLMEQFRKDTVTALEDKISLNPILNSFQKVVHDYNIQWELIDTFLKSMEMDLDQSAHDQQSYKEYIVGSAEVVGLMCLRVFVKGDVLIYEKQKPHAMSLGSAFQKVNFLRDAKEDFDLGRIYFPNISMEKFDQQIKNNIESDIEKDFQHALIGIRELPSEARLGVYLAYIYYKNLFHKIKSIPPERIMKERIRVPNLNKFGLLFQCYFRNQFNIL
jgi:phytoene/squalene synthetase